MASGECEGKNALISCARRTKENRPWRGGLSVQSQLSSAKLASAQERQHRLWQLISLGNHRRTSLLQDL